MILELCKERSLNLGSMLLSAAFVTAATPCSSSENGSAPSSSRSSTCSFFPLSQTSWKIWCGIPFDDCDHSVIYMYIKEIHLYIYIFNIINCRFICFLIIFSKFNMFHIIMILPVQYIFLERTQYSIWR